MALIYRVHKESGPRLFQEAGGAYNTIIFQAQEGDTVKKRILFLMSDTGGGHRAAAEAIRDALIQRYGADHIDATLVDVFRASRFPFNYMPELYPWLVNRSKSSYAMSYRLSNSRRGAAWLSRTFYATNARRLRRMIIAHPADVVVCVHSIIARPSKRAYDMGDSRPPFITVVTDLVTTHMFWYDKTVERCLVPTQTAYDRGLKVGLTPSQMRVTGLPIHPDFLQSLGDKDTAREELGWHDPRPVVLMVAGGDGMGRLYETARAIDAKKLPCQLAIIAGRNQVLKQKLDSVSWNQPVHIYGFVKNMPRLMTAADMIVTKAGPATITEAAMAGLPMIIYDAIPGQEDGNVTHVVDNQAGAFAPDPEEAAQTVAAWLGEGSEGLQRRSQNARRIVNPNAVWEIADEVWQWAHRESIPCRVTRRFWRFRRRNQQS